MEDFDARYQKQMEEEEKQFKKAFNAGYLLQKHEPELLDRILKSANEDRFYLQAMTAGKKQQEKDKFIDQMKQTQEQSKNKQRNK